ncbi:putative exported protein [Plasmodium reichenowi]|uniref:Putative exported protein n=1 Tax=Plasmodium reichenowi TaxID=5854 RepID=A0A151L315_PLARE|nr:putative exported protein [Plasmodium reichenowi]KYN93247.1 putative exported protein [Plasmodium reichenowi]
MSKNYFRIYLYNLIIVIISLQFKSYYKKGAYNNGNNNNIHLDKHKRLLSQHITDEPLQHTLSTINVENCKGLNNKYGVVCTLNDKGVNNKMLDKKTDEKNIIGYNVLNYTLNKEYDKYHKKNISLKRNKKNKPIKDLLYKMMFKGKNFWNFVKNVITVLGFTSLISNILWITLYLSSITSVATVFGCVSLGTVLLIIILCVLFWLLVTWLWPYKDEYNRKHKK